MLMNFGGGMFINLGDGNWFTKLLGILSPFRFASEMMLRSLLKGLPYVDTICEQFDFTYKDQCLPIIVGYSCLYVFLGWIFTLIKARFL